MEEFTLKNRIEKHGETFIAISISAILAFLFLLNSPLHPWRCAPTATDSSVFKTIAMMMDMGYMPYRDSFDHKGPLLYVINYWGQLLAYYRGVWAFEAIGMTFTIFMLYKIARLKAKILSSAFIVLTAISMLFGFFNQGNLTEEYAMPFIAIGIYIFLDYLLNDKISALRIVISGISMGAVCLLRPNMVAVWVVFGTAIVFDKVRKQNWKELGRFVFYFIIGFLAIVMPFLVWLYINNALLDCFRDYLVFNMQYCSISGERASLRKKWESFSFFGNKAVYIMSVIGAFYGIRKNVFLNSVYAAYMIVSLLFLCMSGQTYGHYGMTLIPAVIYPLSLMAEDLERIPHKKTASAIKILIGIYLAGTVLLPASIDTMKRIPVFYAHRGQNQFPQTAKTVSKIITDLTTADESISVYGNQDIYYVWTRRKHATKYSYQFPIGQVMPKIMNEYMQQLAKELPPVIVVSKGLYDKNISSFLGDHQYTKVWAENNSDDKQSTLVFYRPKQ